MAMTDTQSAEQAQQETPSRGIRGRRFLGGGEINVNEGERYGSTLGGAGLVLAGLVRRGWAGAILGTLGAALLQRGITGHCPMYERLGISSAKSDRPGVPGNAGTMVERSITIARSPEEIFAFWRNFANLAHFMAHIRRVEVIDDKRSHWVAVGPGGKELQWDAVVINEHPNSMIAWESLPGADVQSAGSVRFNPAPGGRGTEVRVLMEYNPPGGVIGALVAKLFGEAPEQQMDEDLGRLKQMLEVGEIATVHGQPSGRA